MFGSNYGLVVITPGKIVNNSTVTPMAAFTNLRINGIAMRPGYVDSPLAVSYTHLLLWILGKSGSSVLNLTWML